MNWMRKKSTWYTIGLCALMLAVFLIGHRTGGNDIVHAEKMIPEKAKTLGTWIDEQSSIFTVSKAEMEEYLAKQTAAGMKMQTASETANGYRKALCLEFGLIRKDGTFIEDASCVQSFQ